ncbi:chymotrypsin inhibitor-like [Megachile rotundata]|uniref:chymotrypsin inhibitor-like n=1 Tax=Megachile rotundata TaxID=143995 RepID=UPI003FD5B469
MTRFLFALFVALAVFSVLTLVDAQCGENQVWDNCGSSCPTTCEDSGPKTCIMQCVAGCTCKEGFVKNSVGACVSPSQC